MLEVDINSFGYSNEQILHNISFKLNEGAHLAILGESGCGKSTLLHLIYGLLHLENGSIYWNEKRLLGPKHNLIPGESFIKLVAQEFNVMPFISVAENIATHLSRLDETQDARRVSELLKVVDMEAFRDTMVKNLSGGQKQRVALAKALAETPNLLLLDEPFSNIDTFRKNKLRRNLFSYLKENNISCITATHDSEEALGYADEMLILKEGAVDVQGTPEQVYSNINSVYQAGFFGEVTVLPSKFFPSKKLSEDIIFFPYQLKVSEKDTPLKVTVKKWYFRGSHYLIHATLKDTEVFFEHPEKLIIGKIYNISAI